MEDQLLDTQGIARVSTNYAGFWIRVGAALLDGILLQVINYIIVFATGGTFGEITTTSYITSLVIPWIYYALMESSSNQATLGKMACGIVVTDMDGERITFARATGRYFGKIISFLILFIGFIMVAFTEKKQGLHDIMAGTLVLNK